MGNILTSNGNVILSNGNAFEVTSSIDSNITPGNIKKDVSILGVTGTYEGSGGGTINASIVNPINGAIIGTSRSVGRITHQYQVTGGTISECYIITSFYHVYCGYSTDDPNYSGYDYQQDSTIPAHIVGFGVDLGYQPPLNGCDIIISITDSGLLAVNYNRNNEDVNEYEWKDGDTCIIALKLNNGYTLYDSISFYDNYSCFIKDTMISLSNNSTKLIQDITYDDELLVWNFDEGKYDKSKSIWIKKEQKTTWYYKLTLSDGNILCVTGTYPEAHSLFSIDDCKFVHANKLVGKNVYTLDGIKTIVSCEEIHEEIEFYNVITNYHMNLFANKILSSTSLNNIYPISNMKFAKEDRSSQVDYSFLSDEIIEGLRLNEQPNDVSNYCRNLVNNKI